MNAPTPETIAAIATPPGVGGVGIVRISGSRAFSILQRLAPSLSAKLPAPHRLRLVHLHHPDSNDLLDEALVVCMPSPRSYTSEDVVEIHGHGGPVNMRRLLDAVCSAGARPALPGEFTQRAFLNGRLDLTQAEAVADIIHASSETALKLAQSHLSGSLGRAIEEMQESLIVATTLTEAAIDFSTEEHVYQLDHKDLIERLERLMERLDKLLGTFDAGRQAREGVQVVILGRPNAGKSTLFNLLCGHDRAIVTEIPGTTRDYLEESVHIHGVTLRLIDTAGLRETTDTVEHIGVHRSRSQAAQADIIIWLLDASSDDPIHPEDTSTLQNSSAAILPVFNKIDLFPEHTPPDLPSLASYTSLPPHTISIKASLHIESFTQTLARIARQRIAPAGEGAVITRLRHREALSRALESIQRAHDAAHAGLSHEFIALDLRLALEATGDILGQVTTDNLLARIFSEFCVGK